MKPAPFFAFLGLLVSHAPEGKLGGNLLSPSFKSPCSARSLPYFCLGVAACGSESLTRPQLAPSCTAQSWSPGPGQQATGSPERTKLFFFLVVFLPFWRMSEKCGLEEINIVRWRTCSIYSKSILHKFTEHLLIGAQSLGANQS